MPHKDTLLNAIRPVLLVNMIFGVGMIEFPVNHPRVILTYLYGLAHLILYGITAHYASGEIKYFDISSSVRQFMCRATLIGNILLTIATIGISFSRLRTAKECINRIAVADNVMETVGIAKDYSRKRRQHFIGIIFLMMTFTVLTCVNASFMFIEGTPMWTRIVLTYATHYPIIIMHLADSTFLYIASYAGKSFQNINKILIQISKGCHSISNDGTQKVDKIDQYVISRKSDYKEIISTIRESHLHIIKICREANIHFGLHTLLSLSFSFLMITGLMYNIYVGLFLSSSSFIKFSHEFISICCWLFFYITKILALTCICSATVEQSVKTGEIIPELSMHQEIRSETQQFLIQMIQNPLEFTARGFCTIDHTLVRQMSGTIMTYLVILIQLSDSSIEIPRISKNNTMSNNSSWKNINALVHRSANVSDKLCKNNQE